MYTQFFGFKEKPFNVTPDPKFLYMSASHKEALAAMLYGIQEKRGFIAIIGEVGTGKTTLLRSLLQELDESTATILVFNTRINFAELLQYIFWELDIPANGMGKQELIHTLNQYLITKLASGGNVALIIDEAQNLPGQVLEELRMLSNLETDTQKLIQVVLVGQPEFNTQLNSPALRQLRQRIGIRCYLTPLNDQECREYITHRLTVAGRKNADLFSKKAVEHICSHAQGIPRIINTLCDNALLTAYSRNIAKITPEIADEVIADFQQSELPKKKKTERSQHAVSGRLGAFPKLRRALIMFFSLVLAALLAAGIFSYRNNLSLLWWLDVFAHNRTGINQAVVPNIPPEGENQQPVSSNPAPVPDAGIPQESPEKIIINHAIQDADNNRKIIEAPAPPVMAVNEVENEPPAAPVPETISPWPSALTAQQNDTLSNMAIRLYGMVNDDILDRIKRVNPEIKDLNVIRIGQTIFFPILAVDNTIIEIGRGIYSVHMASFSSYDQAKQFLDKLTQEKYPIVISSVGGAGKAPWYRITMGSFASREQAIKAAQGMVNPLKSDSELTGQPKSGTPDQQPGMAAE